MVYDDELDCYRCQTVLRLLVVGWNFPLHSVADTDRRGGSLWPALFMQHSNTKTQYKHI